MFGPGVRSGGWWTLEVLFFGGRVGFDCSWEWGLERELFAGFELDFGVEGYAAFALAVGLFHEPAAEGLVGAAGGVGVEV